MYHYLSVYQIERSFSLHRLILWNTLCKQEERGDILYLYIGIVIVRLLMEEADFVLIVPILLLLKRGLSVGKQAETIAADISALDQIPTST